MDAFHFPLVEDYIFLSSEADSGQANHHPTAAHYNSLGAVRVGSLRVVPLEDLNQVAAGSQLRPSFPP